MKRESFQDSQGLWTSKRISKPKECLRNKKRFFLWNAGTAPKKSWLLPTGSSHQVFLSMIVYLSGYFPRRGSSWTRMCKQKILLELLGMWDFKLSVFLTELAQHVRHWHKTLSWDSTAASSVSPVLPKHILQHHPKRCICCIISNKCRTFTFFLLLVITTSNVSSCISAHRGAQHLSVHNSCGISQNLQILHTLHDSLVHIFLPAGGENPAGEHCAWDQAWKRKAKELK